jgi:hypothetical protein
MFQLGATGIEEEQVNMSLRNIIDVKISLYLKTKP